MNVIEPADLKDKMGYMSQDNFLFMGTLRDNIIAGSKFIDNDNFMFAAKLSGVDEIAMKNEMGYDLDIGERGEGLSGGEKQAVSLARAVVHNPKILVLDEPTSQMDNQSEAKIIRNLKSFTHNKTLILITHKFSLLPLVNRIILIDNGKIIEDGPKDLIIERLKKGQVRIHG